MILGIEASHANKINRTGVEEYCFQIIERLKKIIPADTRVILYSEKKLIEPLNQAPSNWEEKIIRWPFKKGWSQFALSKHFLKNSPNVFFAPGQLVPFICPKNTVTMVHDSAFKVFPDAYGFFGRQYLKAMNRLIIEKSKKIITPSEFSKNELIRIYNYTEPQNIDVVYHGYDATKYKPREIGQADKDTFMARYKITKPFYFFVGRLEDKKNLVNIIKAFDKIKKQTDVQLVLAGIFGRGGEKIKSAIESSANKKDIITTGWVHENDLPLFYNLALALIFATKYEGFGLPLLNAMASGCPTIASKGNCLEEIGADSAVYASVDSLDEIAESAIKLAFDSELREKIIEKGLKRAGCFSWDKTAVSTWQILRKAAQ